MTACVHALQCQPEFALIRSACAYYGVSEPDLLSSFWWGYFIKSQVEGVIMLYERDEAIPVTKQLYPLCILLYI